MGWMDELCSKEVAILTRKIYCIDKIKKIKCDELNITIIPSHTPQPLGSTVRSKSHFF